MAKSKTDKKSKKNAKAEAKALKAQARAVAQATTEIVEAEIAAGQARPAADPHVLRAAAIGVAQETITHPWNPNAEMIGVQLGQALGLQRTNVAIVRIPPGKDSSAAHANQRAEEWVYVLMGQGRALLEDKEIEIGAGDFLAFPAPQALHVLRNVGPDDLVCLMGGENLEADVVDYPAAGKITVRTGARIVAFDAAAASLLDAPKKPKKKSKKT